MLAHINAVTGAEQSVKEHCINTAEKAFSIAREINIGSMAYLAGLVHDLGKCTEVFQNYLKLAVVDSSMVTRGEVTHSTHGGILIYERYYQGDEIHRLTAQLLTMAVFNHHGLYDVMTPEGKDVFHIKIQKKDELYYGEALRNYLDSSISLEELDQCFDRAVKEVTEIDKIIMELVKDYPTGKERGRARDFYYTCLLRMLLSVLIDADRLDTAAFCSGKAETIQFGESTMQLPQLWEILSARLESGLSQLSKVSPLTSVRNEISDRCLEFSNNGAGIYKLMVPTGGGKTLAALRFALKHAQVHKKQRIFYVAPYTSILDQNAEVIKNILHNEDIILEHHSNVVSERENEAQQDRNKLLAENYDCPIVLTTMVQLLNTLFDGRTQCIRRMHSFSDAIIILDEIQTIPAKCIHIFNMAANFLAYVCNATILLCTATQPMLDREVKHKLIMGKPENMIPNAEDLYRSFRRVEVIDKMGEVEYDAERLSAMMTELMEDAHNILAVMNTKSDALELYQSMKERLQEQTDASDIQLFFLTTGMCPQHRMDRITAIREKLGKVRMICISTSLIEAGVDISFECVIRSAAGLDSIAQAAGRCNRNGMQEQGTVYIIKSKSENLSRLEDIKNAQLALYPVLEKYREVPEYFASDLLSPKAIDCYFRRYYKSIGEKMDYSLKDKNSNLFDLLSVNETGIRAYCTNTQEVPKLLLNQAIKSAGNAFEVIVNQSIDVIVPYNERARELICDLNGTLALKEVRKILKQAQAYTVNLFKYQFKKLDEAGGVYKIKDLDIYAISDSFYSQDTGVTVDAENSFLSI